LLIRYQDLVLVRFKNKDFVVKQVKKRPVAYL